MTYPPESGPIFVAGAMGRVTDAKSASHGFFLSFVTDDAAMLRRIGPMIKRTDGFMDGKRGECKPVNSQ
jgi:hypothetical protein